MHDTHLISNPVTNASVNPSPSNGVAFSVGDWAMAVVVLIGPDHGCSSRRDDVRIHHLEN
jgi:hypothetical protein